MRETNAMPLFMVRLKAWDKFQAVLKTPFGRKGVSLHGEPRDVHLWERYVLPLALPRTWGANYKQVYRTYFPQSFLGFKWVLIFHQLIFLSILNTLFITKLNTQVFLIMMQSRPLCAARKQGYLVKLQDTGSRGNNWPHSCFPQALAWPQGSSSGEGDIVRGERCLSLSLAA